MFRSGNPALTAWQKSQARAAPGAGMTINGTITKTGFSLLILLMTASWIWGSTPIGPNMVPRTGLIFLGAIAGLILAMVTIFKMQWAPITTPLYAGFEGLFLGGISATFEARFPGIVMQAVALTFGTLFAMLTLYRSGVIKVTDKFRTGLLAAGGGILLVYMFTWIMSIFGMGVPFIHQSGMLGIGFSLIVVVIAALFLVLDFDLIARASAQGAPKYMEWYGAFSLMVTLVWLYMEILRLLGKLRGR